MAVKEKNKEMALEEFQERQREAYAMLRTNLMGQHPEATCITFLSTKEEEGRSQVTYGLAEALADCGKTVVLVDGDLRKAGLTEEVKTTLGKDLSVKKYWNDCLTDVASLEGALCKLEEGMDFLPAMETPAEAGKSMAKGKYADLFQQLKEKYDYVLVDTPAFSKATDALQYSMEADGLVVVTQQGIAKQKELQDMAVILKQNQIAVLGTVWKEA